MTKLPHEVGTLIKAQNVPLRTCVGCRSSAARQDLVRMVAVAEGASVLIRLDFRAVKSGRGVWLHANSACLTTALQRKAIQRSLHLTGHLDLTEVEKWCDQLLAEGA